MIKYFENRDKKQVIAVLDNCKWDAYNKIDKVMNDTGFIFSACCPNYRDKFIMPDTFKVTVTCDPRDEYDFEVGKQIAKKKLMRNYYKSLDKRLNMFTCDFYKLADKVNNAHLKKR